MFFPGNRNLKKNYVENIGQDKNFAQVGAADPANGFEWISADLSRSQRIWVDLQVGDYDL